VTTEAIAWDMHVVLVEPEIPHNTGAIARLCLATGSTLHLVGRLGFRIDDRSLKRAGLDYWQHTRILRHDTFDDFRQTFDGPVFAYSKAGTSSLFSVAIPNRAALVFGSETRGLPDRFRSGADPLIAIPIWDERVRSLNLATAVGIVLYDAIRQCESRRQERAAEG
jgi:tRNA (cytidine/uridine-2'-O-)-methyltransferase